MPFAAKNQPIRNNANKMRSSRGRTSRAIATVEVETKKPALEPFAFSFGIDLGLCEFGSNAFSEN
jgi:hypothetical protein